jgi:predicted nucleic-acid-binding Zn-ribbon protein
MEHQRAISLQCPTCGSTDFESDESDDSSAPVKCNTCKRETTRQQLIEDNAEFIDIQNREFQQEVLVKAKQELQKNLRDAFKGGRFVRIK